MEPLQTAADLITLAPFIRAALARLEEPHADEFLNYDARWLRRVYGEEQTAGPQLPYAELTRFPETDDGSLGSIASRLELRVVEDEFRLGLGDHRWQRVRAAGYDAITAKRVGENERQVRLAGYAVREGIHALAIQPAWYSDQAQSNLVLDYPHDDTSLRNLLRDRYDRRFPPFSDDRMANTIGVACLLFYPHRGRLVPYLVKRVTEVGVYPGMLHCTASGGTQWPSGQAPSLTTVFEQSMYRELDEEVGLAHSEIELLRPIALCREFLRAGKPQLFYVGITMLPRGTLRRRRVHAANCVRFFSLRPEIEHDRWLRSSDVVVAPGKLASSIQSQGLSLEGIAAAYYAGRWLECYRNDLRCLGISG